MKSLTIKQQKFAILVAKHGNRIQAIFEAGYGPKSARVASQLAYKLMQNRLVQLKIQNELDKRFSDTLQHVIDNLRQILNADLNKANASHKLKAILIIGRLLGWEKNK